MAAILTGFSMLMARDASPPAGHTHPIVAIRQIEEYKKATRLQALEYWRVGDDRKGGD
jgi:hypothetical protein